MRHSTGFISPSHNLSCLATICRLLPVIGRVSGDYWWLTDWGSEAQSRVSCPMRVRWFLTYDQDADLFRCGIPVSTLKCTLIGHVGFQPLNKDSRSNPTPEGFEPLTKSSRSNSPINCTLWQYYSSILCRTWEKNKATSLNLRRMWENNM